jgi:hypothetical protein
MRLLASVRGVLARLALGLHDVAVFGGALPDNPIYRIVSRLASADSNNRVTGNACNIL